MEPWEADPVASSPLPFDKDYNTILTPEEETQFQTWKLKNAPKDSGADYDLRGAFKSGLQPDPKTAHWPDTFKKPNHPTFSNESQYAPFGTPGHWNNDEFVPPVIASQSDVRKVDNAIEEKAQYAKMLGKQKMRTTQKQMYLNMFTPVSEQLADERADLTPANFAELEAEINRTKDPKKLAILNAEHRRMKASMANILGIK